MDKKVSITIEYGEAMYLERLYFEYMASLNILRYLTSQDGTKEEYLDRYNKSYEEKYTAFELAKQDVLDKYKPEGMEEYNYFIDFDRARVEYTEK